MAKAMRPPDCPLGQGGIEPGHRIISYLLYTVLLTALAGTAWAAEQAPSVLVTTTNLQRGQLPRTVSAYGTVEADPSAKRAIMATASATVAQIYVRLGQMVDKGAPLLQMVPNPQTQADYARARSALSAANAQLQHTRELLSQYLATKQQLVDAEKAQSDARVALDAFQSQGAGGAKIFTAPFRATVTKIDANTGMFVAEGAALLELAPPSALVLRVGIVPSEANAIAAGNPAKIKPLGSNHDLASHVLLRGAVVNPGDGLVPVEVAIPSNTLLPGETATATISTNSVSGFVVPHTAVLINDQGQTYVVQVSHGKAVLVTVRVLNEAGGRNVIAGKLDLKAPVVLSGARQLQNAMNVRLSSTQQRSH